MKMLEKLEFLLFFIITFILNQEIDYEKACTAINVINSTYWKTCTIAPRNENKRCCYLSYKENDEKVGECIYVINNKDGLKAVKNEYKDNGKSKVKIQCNSFYIQINIIMICFIIFYVIFF